MTSARYRAWRFVHPDLDNSDPSPGVGLNARGAAAMVDGADSIRQAILLLLSTVPGERVMRPDYGCELHRLLFSPNDDTTAGLAIYYVRRALQRWEPRIDILDIDAGRNLDRAEQLDVRLDYRVRSTQRLDTVVVSVNLAGA
jgi:phage baseplate assembly protein W